MPSTSVDKPPFNEYVSITEVCEILDSRRKPVTKANRIPGPYPYYGATGVQDWVDSYIFDEPLVLIAEDCGNFGFRNQVAYKVAGKCWVNNHAHVLRPLEGFDIDFLVLALNNLDYSSLVNGTTRKKLNLAALKKIFVPRIPIREQKVISSRFLNIKTLIRKCELIQDKLDQLIKSRFVEMFGDIYTSTKWEKVYWSEVVSIQNGKDYKQHLVESGGYPVCGSGGEIARADDYLCPENTVIIGRKGTINNPILMKEKFWNVDTAFGVIPSERINIEYLYAFCKQFDFSQLSKQATLPSTTKKDLLNITIMLPPLSLQNEFADFVAQVDKLQFVTLSLRYYNRGKMKWSVG